MDLFENIRSDGTRIELSIPRQHIQLQPHQPTLLKQPEPLFLPCEDIITTQAAVTFTFTQDNTKHLPFSQIGECSKVEQFLILIHAGRFITDFKKHHSTSFDPRNIVFTRTGDVAFLLRILPGSIPQLSRTALDEFEDYKALVLSVLQDKYTFRQLIQYGLDTVAPNPLCQAIIDAPSPQELEALLVAEHTKAYNDARQNRVGFSKRFINTISVGTALLLAILTAALTYFVYDNVTKTRTYGVKMYIYENYYNRNPLAVVDYANKLRDKDMDASLKRVVADALIATNDPQNLAHAFRLDAGRQVEVIEKLILLEEYDIIATLASDNHLAQLYQAYYGKDYQRAITLGESYPDLKFNAQAQILLAKTYIALNDYPKAETILKDLGDLDQLLDTYKQHRESVQKNETNIERRQHMVKSLDDIIKLLEDIQKAKSS
ncbi:MAG: tetratricopeptide repeat protein [Peptococcaceae bacterium]|nr:tetratricopeptide repeat protein [Peptococcaceae bacterium]